MSQIIILIMGLITCSSIGSAADADNQVCGRHTSAYHYNDESSQCLPWKAIDPVSCPCKCRKDQKIDEIRCLNSEVVLLEFGYCLTHEDDPEMFQFGLCPYLDYECRHQT